MKVIVSAQASKVILSLKDRLWCYPLDAEPFPCVREDIPLLIGAARDVRTVDVDSPAEALEALEASWKCDRALHLAIILLSARSRGATRSRAAGQVKDLIASDEVQEFVSNRLYSATLPQGADLTSALRLAREVGAAELGTFLDRLAKNQHAIYSVERAFNEVPTTLFNYPHGREQYRLQAVACGFWRQLVESDSKTLRGIHDKRGYQNSPLELLDQDGQILAAWTARLGAAEPERFPSLRWIEDLDLGTDIDQIRAGLRSMLDRFAPSKVVACVIEYGLSLTYSKWFGLWKIVEEICPMERRAYVGGQDGPQFQLICGADGSDSFNLNFSDLRSLRLLTGIYCKSESAPLPA